MKRTWKLAGLGALLIGLVSLIGGCDRHNRRRRPHHQLQFSQQAPRRWNNANFGGRVQRHDDNRSGRSGRGR